MPDLSPAETLTAAAERLKWLLHEDGMPEQIRGLWLAPSDGIHGSITAPGQDVPVAQAFWGGVAEYAAAMHPGVGLALVDWLELEAGLLEALPADNSEALKTVPARLVLQSCRHALAVARQILGGAS